MKRLCQSLTKTEKMLLDTKRKTPLKMSEAIALLCEKRGKLKKKMINTPKDHLLRDRYKSKVEHARRKSRDKYK